MNLLFCSQKLNHGGDSTGLGRWAFSRFQGRGNTSLCVYAAYCPVKNSRNPGSVWNQHCRFFSDTREDPNPNPRALFADDLCRSISARLAAGDSVILGLDHNEDVRTGSLGVKFKTMGMIDSILTLHSSLSPPATFNRNKSRTPIDAIWTSPNISVLRGGYCAFGGQVGMRSDHRQLWIEVDNSSIFAKHLPSSFSTPKSRLRSEDPRSRKKYIKLTHQAYSEYRITQGATQIKELVHSFAAGNESTKSTIMDVYEGLHKDTSKARLAIESKLQSRYVGQVPWSPKLQKFRDKISLEPNCEAQKRG